MRSIHVVRPLESISTEDELFMKRLLIQTQLQWFLSLLYLSCFNITVFLYFFPFVLCSVCIIHLLNVKKATLSSTLKNESDWQCLSSYVCYSNYSCQTDYKIHLVKIFLPAIGLQR